MMSAENFRSRSSLIHVKQGLRESDLLLTFYLIVVPGPARADARLLGRTRAWMMVIPNFNRYLLTSLTAEALRRRQLELLHSGTWQASPSYGAVFQVAGGGR